MDALCIYKLPLIIIFLSGMINHRDVSIFIAIFVAFIQAQPVSASSDASLAGYWKLNSVNSTNYTKDFSGYGNDGKLSGYHCDPATCNPIAEQTQAPLRSNANFVLEEIRNIVYR